MSIWKTKSGDKLAGDMASTSAPVFEMVPNGTKATCDIQSFEKKKFDDGSEIYQIVWRLLDTDYANYCVRHKLDVYSDTEKKADRARNMMYRIFKLAGITPQNPELDPTDADLAKFLGLKYGVLFMEWEDQGKRGNWVNAIYDLNDKKFTPKTGVFKDTLPPATIFQTPSDKFVATKADDDTFQDVPF